MALAMELLRQAFERQIEGELDLAVLLYRRSIEIYPTAEAYTFLGRTYRSLGKMEQAIDECKNAILTDPTYGDPYNDIGECLIELDRPEEAIPWLERAIASKRYETYHYPWYNLGRAYLRKEWYNKARRCFEKALEIEPRYTLATEALQKLKLLVQ